MEYACDQHLEVSEELGEVRMEAGKGSFLFQELEGS